jgi:hypothetical protein
MNKLIRYLVILALLVSIFAVSAAPVLAAEAPDLQPTQIEVTTLYANAANTVSVVIANNGNVSASNFAIKLEVSASSGPFAEVTTKTGNSIAAHNDASYWPLSVNFSWKPAAAGSYILRVTVDTTNAIAESNETNNILQQSATVVPLTPVTVKVRVEGKTATIWSGQVTFSTSTITDKQGTVFTVDHPTALGALNQAAQSGGFSYVVSSAYGPWGFVESVAGDAGQGADGWLYRANWQSPSVAACDFTLANNDEVLWYYGGWAAKPLKLSVDQTNIPVTGNFTATVQAFDGANWNAVQGATVQAVSHLYTTDANGKVLNIPLSPGGYTVSATIGTYDTFIRSNSISVVVYVPLNLLPGWNFISIPKRLTSDNSTTQVLFGTVNTAGHSIFIYNPTSGWTALGATSTVSPLDGIWIFSASAVELHPVFDPNPQQVPPTKQLAAGWNAIGFTALTPAAANSTLASVANGWSTLIGFDAASQTSETSIIKGSPASDPTSESRQMSPWKGYWLNMTVAGQLAAISY